MINCNIEANDTAETQRSLTKTNRVCRFICCFMVAVFALLCLWWLASIGVMVFTLIVPGVFVDMGATPLVLAIYTALGAAMAVICLTLIRIFFDASKGRSPFTMLQVHRLRIVAAALLAYAFMEFALTFSDEFMQQDYASFSSSAGAPTLNLFPFVAAAVVFAFSFVFKYGVLLQELSDETL